MAAAALVAQQALVVFVAGQDVDDAPEARPALETAGSHVGGDQAGCDLYSSHEMPQMTAVQKASRASPMRA